MPCSKIVLLSLEFSVYVLLINEMVFVFYSSTILPAVGSTKRTASNINRSESVKEQSEKVRKISLITLKVKVGINVKLLKEL